MRILVVDDNPTFAWCLRIMLEDEGCEVKSAKDSHEGYGAYLEFNPDVVLTDIQMPGESGLKLMEHIRTHDPMVKTIYI
jgi:two-component system, NtrC family, response regulator AtoC